MLRRSFSLLPLSISLHPPPPSQELRKLQSGSPPSRTVKSHILFKNHPFRVRNWRISRITAGHALRYGILPVINFQKVDTELQVCKEENTI